MHKYNGINILHLTAQTNNSFRKQTNKKIQSKTVIEKDNLKSKYINNKTNKLKPIQKSKYKIAFKASTEKIKKVSSIMSEEEGL